VSIEYMRREGLRDVLALDRHFAEMGFRSLVPAR
jgi:predicted nucleic acid-binding protein